MIIMADLMLGNDLNENQETLDFMEKVLQQPELNKHNDLLVILGNAIDGTQWDGKDQNYLQARWDNITQVLISNGMKMAFTFGDKDL